MSRETPPPLYIRLDHGGKAAKTVDVNNLGIIFVDFNENNEVLGIEILHYYEFDVEKDGKVILSQPWETKNERTVVYNKEQSEHILKRLKENKNDT